MTFTIISVYRNRIIKIENIETKKVYEWMRLTSGDILLTDRNFLVYDQFLKNIITDVCENHLQHLIKN